MNTDKAKWFDEMPLIFLRTFLDALFFFRFFFLFNMIRAPVPLCQSAGGMSLSDAVYYQGKVVCKLSLNAAGHMRRSHLPEIFVVSSVIMLQ